MLSDRTGDGHCYIVWDAGPNVPYGAPCFLTGAEASGHHDMAVQVLMHLMALRAF